MAVSQWFLNGRFWPKVVTAFGVVCLAVSLTGCERGKEGEKAKQAATAPPPPAVVVAEVVQKTVPIYSEFVARTDAKETVEIRARVQAFLEAQHFTEGTVVKKDQLLFTLDKREYEAQLLQAKAQLAKAQADLAFAKDNALVESAKANLDVALARLGKAETDERRLKPLAERRAVPQQDYDNAAANLDGARADVQSRRAAVNTAQVNQKSSIEQAEAAIEAANAAIAQAELNLSYCTIKSPIEGLIGKREVAPGNLVGKSEATLLATVSSIDPIRVDLSISEAEYLNLMALRKTGAVQGGRAAGTDAGRRQRLPAQRPGRDCRPGRGPEDRNPLHPVRIPEPRGAPAPRPVRPRAGRRRDGRECHPGSPAGRPGNPGHQERAGGRRRQHGDAAHHLPRRERRRPPHRARWAEAGRAGDRGWDPEGPAGLPGQPVGRRQQSAGREGEAEAKGPEKPAEAKPAEKAGGK